MSSQEDLMAFGTISSFISEALSLSKLMTIELTGKLTIMTHERLLSLHFGLTELCKYHKMIH